MDDLLSSMGSCSTHCGQEEYVRLLDLIEIAKYYTNPIDTSKRIRMEVDRYVENLNIDPPDYSILEHVSQKNFDHIVCLASLRDAYLGAIEKEPRNLDKHILLARRFFEALQEGAELGYIVYGRK